MNLINYTADKFYTLRVREDNRLNTYNFFTKL